MSTVGFHIGKKSLLWETKNDSCWQSICIISPSILKTPSLYIHVKLHLDQWNQVPFQEANAKVLSNTSSSQSAWNFNYIQHNLFSLCKMLSQWKMTLHIKRWVTICKRQNNKRTNRFLRIWDDRKSKKIYKMRIFKLNTQIRNKRFHHENQSFTEDDWHIFYKNQI